MASGIYDIITVGGGLGGSTLAQAMAGRGARLLVLERTEQFTVRRASLRLSSLTRQPNCLF